jgi:hypothetical protein
MSADIFSRIFEAKAQMIRENAGRAWLELALSPDAFEELLIAAGKLQILIPSEPLMVVGMRTRIDPFLEAGSLRVSTIAQ